MKRLIRWALNHIPRPVLQRIASWAVPVVGFFYQGSRVECPCAGTAPEVPALRLRPLTRQRPLSALPLAGAPPFAVALPHARYRPAAEPPRTLHIAPEVCIMRHLKPHFAGFPGQYVTADLESPLADLHFDVSRSRWPTVRSMSFSATTCSNMSPTTGGHCASCTASCVLEAGASSSRPWSPTTNTPTRTTRSPTPDERTRIFRAVRPPAHLRRRLRRPAA